MVTIEYTVDPAKRRRVSSPRCRESCAKCGGATAPITGSSITTPPIPPHFVETFMDEIVDRALRQHERVSVADREIQRRAKQYLIAGYE